MATVKKNPVIEGLSGGVGKLVFKQYGDKTVVCQWPEHDPNRQPTAGEARQRGRIKEAAARAKAVLVTETGKAYYEAARKRLVSTVLITRPFLISLTHHRFCMWSGAQVTGC